jgi:hypothetical protein
MGPNRDHVFTDFDPPRDIPFTLDEYQDRLDRIRSRMVAEEIDLVWVSAPESLCYVSGCTCEWYQAQSPAEWPFGQQSLHPLMPRTGISIWSSHRPSPAPDRDIRRPGRHHRRSSDPPKRRRQ